MREQWRRPPKTHRVGAIPGVPERYTCDDKAPSTQYLHFLSTKICSNVLSVMKIITCSLVFPRFGHRCKDLAMLPILCIPFHYPWLAHQNTQQTTLGCSCKQNVGMSRRNHPRGGRPLGSGRQLPLQLTVGRRPLGGGWVGLGWVKASPGRPDPPRASFPAPRDWVGRLPAVRSQGLPDC